MTYTEAMNAAILGHMRKCFGDSSSPKPSKGLTRKRLYMMKLVRYMSRSIHGK